MKNIFRFFGTILTVVLAAALTGCSLEEQLESADLGLHVKVFFPTKVVEGQPMTINGSGFSEATEIVFPGEVVVTDFQIVSNDMIRVNAPAGIAAEGGNIIVRTAEEEAESPLPLTLGCTVISGYSVEPGMTVDGGSQITIYGTDLEFINAVELLDADGNPALVEDKAFNKKATATIIFTVPKKVYDGTFVGKVCTIDGKAFEMPELTYKPASDGGYFETVQHVIWENPDPAGIGAVSWSGQYRFYGEGNADSNNECIAMIAADHWNIIKTGTFYLKFAPAADAYQIRANTGWWSFDSAGAYDIHGGDERIIDNGDGTFSLAYTLSEEPLASGILGLIDEQHLLFTGNGYTPLMLYYTEEVWVPGGSVEIVRESIWKNDGSVPAASWSGSPYRFAPETNSTGEEVYAVPTDTWEKMKTTPFKVDIQPAADWFQIRILDGWWSVGNNDANDITPNYEGLVDNGDGTFTFVLDLPSKPDLVPVLDEKHLLFAGDAFTILEMYWEEEVFVPGGGETPTEVVLWEGEAIADDWGNQPNILSDAGVELQEAGAQPGQIIYLYMEPIDPAQHWYLELVEGHWSGVTYLTLCSIGADTQDKFVEYDLEANGGRAALEITQEMLDTAYVQQWWGGTFIANGDNLKITKVTLL
jgi:hypothetical protein